MNNPLVGMMLLPWLAGFLPIMFARTWPARCVAIVFGLVGSAFGVCFAWETGPALFRRPDVAFIGVLSTALVSIVVTYLLDKKHDPKA